MLLNSCTKRRLTSSFTVLVVDDSFFMRTLISDVLRAVPEVAAVVTASSGMEAIRKTCEIRPDCVMLDLMMPGLDGLMTLKIIMSTCPTPVIILSGHSREGTDITYHCRAAGAVSYISKPSGQMSLNIETIREQLANEVAKVARSQTSSSNRRYRHTSKPGMIVFGASTGGQATLELILGTLEPDLAVPIVVVQHAPNRFLTECFARRLNHRCALPVKLIEEGELLHPGVIHLAPGGTYMSVKNSEMPFTADCSRMVHECNGSNRLHASVDVMPDALLTPSIDVAMQSAANMCGSNVIGVILTGMGIDGVEGMRAIKKMGGRTIVQDQSAAMFDMPKAVIDAGLADEVLSPNEIAQAIQKVMNP